MAGSRFVIAKQPHQPLPNHRAECGYFTIQIPNAGGRQTKSLTTREIPHPLRFRVHNVVEVFEVIAGDRLCAVSDLHIVVTPAPEGEILGPVEEPQPGVPVFGNPDIKAGIDRHLRGRMTAPLTGLHISIARVDILGCRVKLSIPEVEPRAAQSRIDLQLLLRVQVLLDVNEHAERATRIAERFWRVAAERVALRIYIQADVAVDFGPGMVFTFDYPVPLDDDMRVVDVFGRFAVGRDHAYHQS